MLQYYILLFEFIIYVSSAAKRAKEDLKCIKANKWQNVISSTKIIENPQTCTSISSYCCYINMTYTYIDHKIESQYCASLSGNLEQFKTYLNNLYNDDLFYYSNYTYRHKADYKNRGRQFDYNYAENFTCNQPPNRKNYSTYLINNCGKFDNDGNCLFEKDTYYFSNFTRSFYRNYTSDLCLKEVKGQCVKYNGTRSNNAMLRPLLIDLIGYLHIDEPNYVLKEDNDLVDFNPDDEEQITDKWPTNFCKPIPIIDFQIICPSNYVFGEFLKFSKFQFFYLLFLILIVL